MLGIGRGLARYGSPAKFESQMPVCLQRALPAAWTQDFPATNCRTTCQRPGSPSTLPRDVAACAFRCTHCRSSSSCGTGIGIASMLESSERRPVAIQTPYYHCTRSDQFDFLLLYLSPPFSDSGRTLTSRFCMVLGTMCEILKRIR